MRTLVCTAPEDFCYEERPVPITCEGEVLLRIRRVGICGTDLHAFEGTQPFFTYPRILGHELAADIADPGQVPGFEKGEPVTIIPYFNCGNCVACNSGKPNCCTTLRVCGVHTDGGMAEYICVPAYSLVKAQGLDYDALALVEPLAIGAHAVRRAGVEKNEWVLVIGAGPIGLATMEFARIAGARVIAIDSNSHRLRFCSENTQAAFAINPLEEVVNERLRQITGGDMPAVVIDATGNLQAINTAFQYMAHGGRYVLVGLQKGDISFSHPEFHKKEGTLMSSRNATRADFEHVINSIRNGLVHPANYITHRVSFGQVKDTFPSWLNPDSLVIKAMTDC